MGHGLCKNCYLKARYHSDGGKTKAKMQEYSQQHPEMRKAIWRKHAYGLTEPEWMAIYNGQGGCCAICGAAAGPTELEIDHDHQTGCIRGMLCGNCNRGLGQFKDDIHRLINAQAYLGYRRLKMPRRQIEQAETVLHYFQTAPLAEADLVLRLAKATIAARHAALAPPKTVTTTPKTQARRTRTQTTVSAGAAALPGMQETVG